MMKITPEEMLEAVKNAKPLTPAQKAKLKANGEELKKLSKEELHRQLKEAADDMY